MEPFEKRRKTCNAAAISIVAVAILYCLILAILVKSTDILADSLEGVQSAEADRMALQWVFNLPREFRVWTIIVCIIEVICASVCLYCLIEGTRPPKKQEVANKAVSEVKSSEEEKGDRLDQEDQEQTIEQKVLAFIIHYKKKIIIPYVYYWLVNNGNLGGASQQSFIKFVKDNTGIKVSPATMSIILNKIDDFQEDPSFDFKEKPAYDRMSNYLASIIKKDYPFNLDYKIR